MNPQRQYFLRFEIGCCVWWTFSTLFCYHRKLSMVFKVTITIEWNGWGQPLGSMVFRWFWNKTTIGNDGFRWLCTIGPTMEWLCTIVEVYMICNRLNNWAYVNNDLPNRYVVTYDATRLDCKNNKKKQKWALHCNIHICGHNIPLPPVVKGAVVSNKNKGEHWNAISIHVDITFLCHRLWKVLLQAFQGFQHSCWQMEFMFATRATKLHTNMVQEGQKNQVNKQPKWGSLRFR